MDSMGSWCSTQVDIHKTHNGHWGICGSNCLDAGKKSTIMLSLSTNNFEDEDNFVLR